VFSEELGKSGVDVAEEAVELSKDDGKNDSSGSILSQSLLHLVSVCGYEHFV